MSGRLTTHVLDTASGRPASGVQIELFRLDPRRPLKAVATNADGRTDEPLLSGAPLRIGRYEIAFQIGAYFAVRGAATAARPQGSGRCHST